MGSADVTGVASRVAGLAEQLPWWVKVLVKLVLARLPVRYGGWRTLGVFRHGSMLDADYAVNVFAGHYERTRTWLPTGFSVLELGPGDSLATSVVAAAHGSARTLLVDTASFASADFPQYKPVFDALERCGHDVEALRKCRSVSEMLRVANTVYLTGGLESLRTIPSASIEFIFSQAVIEHIRQDEVGAIFRELHRLQPPGGVASHRVDFQDHLSHSLNSLRFSETTWESELFASSGFYTNRLRASEIEKLLVAAGYEVMHRHADRWPRPPLSRRQMNEAFRGLPDDDLLVYGLDIVVRKPN